MYSRFSITGEDWQQTPTAVQQVLSSLYHQLLLPEVRSQAYERQLAQRREQVAQIDDLKAEMAELRERLGQKSSNSSKPPSSDPPQQRQPTSRQPSDRKLKAVAGFDHSVDIRPKHDKRHWIWLVSAEVGQGSLEQMRESFGLRHRVRDGKIAWSTWQRKVKPIQQGVKHLLLAGTQIGHEKTRYK